MMLNMHTDAQLVPVDCSPWGGVIHAVALEVKGTVQQGEQQTGMCRLRAA